MTIRKWLALVLISSVTILVCQDGLFSQKKKTAKSPYARWKHGPSTKNDYFPIAVWLQHPKNAQRYKDAGFNIQMGLWKGPTEAQLGVLKRVGMKVICTQNEVGRAHLDDPTIIGWLQHDEPDNAQKKKDGGRGYDPPFTPAEIQAEYKRIKKNDPTRPVILNLGQGVAWDAWRGRGPRTNHPEDYPEYMKGGDIVTFDIYPACHPHDEVRGKLEYVAKGVKRLRGWAKDHHVIWNVIECTRINNVDHMATPHEVRAEAWMSIIHGSTGLVYFVHQFKPRFVEAALLADEAMLAAVTTINHQIQELAPVLNSPTRKIVAVQSAKKDVPVAVMAKEYKGTVYIFAVCMRGEETTAAFKVKGLRGKAVEVLYEKRKIQAKGGTFRDTFEGWGVHMYRVKAGKK